MKTEADSSASEKLFYFSNERMMKENARALMREVFLKHFRGHLFTQAPAEREGESSLTTFSLPVLS